MIHFDGSNSKCSRGTLDVTYELDVCFMVYRVYYQTRCCSRIENKAVI